MSIRALFSRFALALVAGVALASCAASGPVTPLQSSEANALGSTSARASAAPSCRSALSTVPDPGKPHGLFVWIDALTETKNNPQILKYLPVDKNLCGASIVIDWSDVDLGPSKGAARYDYTKVEAAIAPWSAKGKLVNLLIANVNETGAANTATPAWVLAQTGTDKVDSVPCADPGSGDTAGPPTPVYWQTGFETRYREFIKAFVGKYGADSRIGYIRFGVGPGAEDFVQHGADGACFAAWQKYGLSAKSWATYSASQVRFVAGLASKAQQLVALNTFTDTAQPVNVPNVVAAAAAASGVGFGTENLGSGNYGTTAESCSKNSPYPYWCDAFEQYAGKVPLEFQTISYTYNPAYPKLAPLPDLLPYAIANHAQIFELYPQDWLAADDPNDAGYAAHHQAWQSAFASAVEKLGAGSQ